LEFRSNRTVRKEIGEDEVEVEESARRTTQEEGLIDNCCCSCVEEDEITAILF
jgi:hypothetical protein